MLRMVEQIIDIADYLHGPVVAEGVETQARYLVLKAMGFGYVQGYDFPKPCRLKIMTASLPSRPK